MAIKYFPNPSRDGARLEVREKVLLLVVCGGSSFWFSCLIVNGYLFIYLCFLCVHLGMDKIILFKIF